MNDEITTIRKKFVDCDYPVRFVNSVINDFNKKENQTNTEDNEDDFIIPPYFFIEEKPFLLLYLPYCINNEKKSKDFIKKFHHFTNESFKIAISWKTRKIQSLFNNIKDKNLYPACKIYHGECVCGEKYIGETVRNTQKRWSEHNNPNKDSEPARHIKENVDHQFEWKVLSHAPLNKALRKNLEAIFIGLIKPSLNKQENFNRLTLFRNGIT